MHPPSASSRVAPPSWGGQATGGDEALWSGGPLGELAAYGSRFVGTPRVDFGSSEYGRDYRLGYGLGVLERAGLDFELGVDAQRRESPHCSAARITAASVSPDAPPRSTCGCRRRGDHLVVSVAGPEPPPGRRSELPPQERPLRGRRAVHPRVLTSPSQDHYSPAP